MTLSPTLISVCVCTYQRPSMLRDLLQRLAKQETNGAFVFEVSIADNDEKASGRAVVEEVRSTFPVPIHYTVEARRNIAHARNCSIANATGSLIALVDDDELPDATWLLDLFIALQELDCAGVLAAVRPLYIKGTPAWVAKGGFFDRPEHPRGYVLPWAGCRSGNVLFRRDILGPVPPWFSPEFGTGGSDVDFFRRMQAAGHVFRWCEKAAVYEYVPQSRCKRRVLFSRALLRGKNLMRHPRGKFRSVCISLVAVPLYVVALPFLHIGGHHLFRRYLIKLGDHLGRLLALVGLNPVKSRSM